MNKDASDFMIAEYERISEAYFNLRGHISEMFKIYITLVGLPLTVLVAATNLAGGPQPVTLGALPDIVAALLLVVAALGLLVAFAIISMRMSMLRYARRSTASVATSQTTIGAQAMNPPRKVWPPTWCFPRQTPTRHSSSR